MRLFFNAILVLTALTACGDKEEVITEVSPPVVPGVFTKDFSYLALGDSYTIGESVSTEESFPYQLIKDLRSNTAGIAPKVIARTGWTTRELMSGMKNTSLNAEYDLITLLIGVNNQYRGNPKDEYREEFKQLLASALKYAGGIKSHVFVLSIPDWGVTPYGKNANTNMRISREIDEFNVINESETLQAGMNYIDITPISRKAAIDVSLIAEDNLHPSAKMYSEWSNALSAEIKKVY